LAATNLKDVIYKNVPKKDMIRYCHVWLPKSTK